MILENTIVKGSVYDGAMFFIFNYQPKDIIMETQFIKARTLSDYIISSSLTLLGLVVMIIALSSAMAVVGAMLALSGIALFFLLKSAWKEKSSGDMYQAKVLYYNRSKKMALLNSLEGDLAALSNIEVEETAQKSLRLDVYYSEDANKVYCQLFEYVPYEYKALTSVSCFRFDQVQLNLK